MTVAAAEPRPVTAAEIKTLRYASQQCRAGAIVQLDTVAQTITLLPMTCGQWSCPYCAARKAHKIAWRIAEAEPTRFITLTTDTTRWDTPAQAYRVQKARWNSLVAAMRKKFGVFEYAAIWELTDEGWPHLHIAQKGCYVPHAWLTRNLPRFGFGRIIQISVIHSQAQAARYLTKYMAKAFAHTLRPGFIQRLVMFSRGFDPPDDEEKEEVPLTLKTQFNTHSLVHVVLRELLACGQWEASDDSTPSALKLVYVGDDFNPLNWSALLHTLLIWS